MIVRTTAAVLAAGACVAFAALPAAARQAPPPAEACAIARAMLEGQAAGPAAYAPAAPAASARDERGKSGRKLLGLAASALSAAAPQISAHADSPLKAAAAQVAAEVVRDSARAGAPMGGGSAAVSAKDREQGLAQAGC